MSSFGRPDAAVRMMMPPVKFSFSRNSRTIPRSRLRSSRDSIFRDTPTWSTVGMNTRNRPASDAWHVSRAPLVPSGSLTTWMRMSCPSRSRFSIFGSSRSSAFWPRPPRGSPFPDASLGASASSFPSPSPGSSASSIVAGSCATSET